MHINNVTKQHPLTAHIDLSVLNPTWAAKLQDSYNLAEDLLARLGKHAAV